MVGYGNIGLGEPGKSGFTEDFGEGEAVAFVGEGIVVSELEKGAGKMG